MIYSIHYYHWKLYSKRERGPHYRYIVYHPGEDYYAVAKMVENGHLDQYGKWLEEGEDLVIDFDDFLPIVNDFRILQRYMIPEKCYLAFNVTTGTLVKIILDESRKYYSIYTNNTIGESDDFVKLRDAYILLDIPNYRDIRFVEEL